MAMSAMNVVALDLQTVPQRDWLHAEVPQRDWLQAEETLEIPQVGVYRPVVFQQVALDPMHQDATRTDLLPQQQQQRIIPTYFENPPRSAYEPQPISYQPMMYQPVPVPSPPSAPAPTMVRMTQPQAPQDMLQPMGSAAEHVGVFPQQGMFQPMTSATQHVDVLPQQGMLQPMAGAAENGELLPEAEGAAVAVDEEAMRASELADAAEAVAAAEYALKVKAAAQAAEAARNAVMPAGPSNSFALSLQEDIRIDPECGGQAVSFEDMCLELRPYKLSFEQLKKHWANLRSATDEEIEYQWMHGGFKHRVPEELAAQNQDSQTASSSTKKPGSAKKKGGRGQRGGSNNASGGQLQPCDTTVMLRNISSRYTAEELIVEFYDHEFEDTFDMLYLPMDFKSHRNMGYCFINFVYPQDAARFQEAFNGIPLQRYKSNKVLEVTRAYTQGLKANLDQYQKKDSQRVRNPWFRPMIFNLPGSEAQDCDLARELAMQQQFESEGYALEPAMD